MKQPPLVLVREWFGGRVYDRRSGRTLPFDHDLTAFLLATCEAPVGECLAREPDPQRREGLEAFALAMVDEGFFTLDDRFDGVALAATPNDGFLTGPLSVHLELTAICNLTCAHCFAGDLPRREAPLTLPELDRLFADLASLGSLRLNLSGGEPLLRRDLLDVLDASLDHGLQPALTTNGLMLTPSLAKALGARDLLWLNVSFDGANARDHDAIRGAGTFDALCEKVAMLRDHCRFSLAFTVMNHNAATLRDCALLAEKLGAETAVFRPMYPVGKGAGAEALVPSFATYRAAVSQIESLGGCASTFSPTTRAEDAATLWSTGTGCGAGATQASISVGGEVNPCGYLGGATVAGNVRETPFPVLWREGQSFARLRALHATHSGCRARALHYGASLDAVDPWMTTAQTMPALGHPLVTLRVRRATA